MSEKAKDKANKKTWISTQTEITKAIESWSTVSEEAIKQEPTKLPPDEKMLKDIESIIQVIKNKLEEFAPPPS